MNISTLDIYSEQLNWLDKQDQVMKQRVCEWSAINSGSYHLMGLKKMKQRLCLDFKPLAGEEKSICSSEIEEINDDGEKKKTQTGDILSISKHVNAPFKILLCGHMDTVFDINHPFQTVTEIDSNRLNGPGVTDMKGGLLVMLYALKALEQSPWAGNIGWQVIINADEEIGSLGSREAIKHAASDKDMALVYEPSMNEQGILAGDRKGSGKFSIVVKGRAAHAGRAFDEGRNAICLLADLVNHVQALNGEREGVTINVGYIKGGGALNVVPDTAVVKIDIRIKQMSDKEWFLTRINALCESYKNKEGFNVSLHGEFGRPPKQMSAETLALFKRIQSLGHMLNLNIDWAPSGGCCDGNNLASYGLPVVDTLGVRGANIHQSTEYLMIDSLVERAKLSALLLMELARGHDS